MGGVTERVPLGGGIKYLFSGWTSLPRTKLIPAGVSKNTSPGGALLVAPPPKKGTSIPYPPLSLDCSFRGHFHAGDKVLSQVLVAPSGVIISTAPCCTKKLLCKKYALLKKPSSQQAHHRFLYPDYERTTTVPLLYYCCIVSTYYQQCCDTSVHSTVIPPMYTYRCKCITPTKLSPPWPVRTANITTERMTF